MRFPPAAVFRCRSQKNELSAIYQWWCCHAAFHRPAGASAAIDYGGWQKGNEHLLYVWREHAHTEGMLCAAYPCPGSQAYGRRLPDGNAGSIRIRPDDLYEAVGSGHDFAVTVSSAACVRRLSAPAYSDHTPACEKNMHS